MELALHLRSISENLRTGDIAEHLATFYPETELDLKWLGGISRAVDRIYIGDEFCPIRLPHPAELDTYCRFSREEGIPLTLLVPVLTDAWIGRCADLFSCLDNRFPTAEVVVNDLGTLFFLKKNHPDFQIALGRLFNKGFKDPRLSLGDTIPSPEISSLLSESTFDNPVFQTLLARLSVHRLERDLMPHGSLNGYNETCHETSYYFPFSYVTTGRGCLIATFSQNPGKALGPHTRCSKPCDTLTLQLKQEELSVNLIQAGNTVFNLYPPEKLNALLMAAGQADYRLVYQGFIL